MTRAEFVLLSTDPVRRIYALVDPARERALVELVASLQAPTVPLFREPIAEELLALSPRLLDVTARPDAVHTLNERCAGRASLVFLQANAPLEVVRRHLRKWLKVEFPNRRRVFFRFYDPRVLLSFVPALEGSEVAEFFGPVRRFVTDADVPWRFTVMDLRLPAAAVVAHEDPLPGGEDTSRANP